MVSIRDLMVSIEGQAVVGPLSLSLPDTGLFALMGPSGCGKTTLLRALAGLLPYQGEINGLRNRNVVLLYQDDRLLPWLTALKNVMVVADETRARAALQTAGLPEDAYGKRPSALSGGMRRRVALARLLAYGGDVWLLDEPFEGIDQDSWRTLTERLRHAAMDKLVLMITHDAAQAVALGAKVISVSGPPLQTQ